MSGWAELVGKLLDGKKGGAKMAEGEDKGMPLSPLRHLHPQLRETRHRALTEYVSLSKVFLYTVLNMCKRDKLREEANGEVRTTNGKDQSPILIASGKERIKYIGGYSAS